MSIDRLSAEDQLMRRWEQWPQEIGALLILDGAPLLDSAGHFRIETVRQRIESALHHVPRFRQVIRTPKTGLGGPFWVDAPAFQISEHVHVVESLATGAESELRSRVESLRRERLDPLRPPWQMWFIPGMREGRIAWFVKLSHAVADGIAAMNALEAFLDGKGRTTAAELPPWNPAAPPGDEELIADLKRRRAVSRSGAFETLAHPLAALKELRVGWPALRELLLGKAPPATSLNRWIRLDQAVALVRRDLKLFQGIARAQGVTVNDVFLSMTGGGLRALLESRGERVENVRLPIYVPMSMRQDRRSSSQGNQVAQMVVPLELGTGSPTERLRQIADETAERKARKRFDLGGALFNSELAARLMLWTINRKPVNVTTANIPGPTEPLSFAGARLLDVFPFIPLVANVGLGVGAVSYAGALTIGIVADRKTYPDLSTFVSGAEAELDALERASRSGIHAPLRLARFRAGFANKPVRATPPIRGPAGQLLPGSIAKVGYRKLGGVDQWVLIRGEDTANPPLILLHGGPGMSEAGFFRYHNAPLEKHFTMVNWDQRGAGKSFDPSFPKSAMTVAQFISDLDELVDLVRERLQAPKVVVLGHSWGTLLGTLYAARFPEKVSAYVGTGQLGDWPQAERRTYQWALTEAQRQRKRNAVKELEAIGPPPYSVAALFVQRNWLARLEGGTSPRSLLRLARMVLDVPESSPFEVPTVFRALRWSMEAMWPEVQHLNLLELAPELKVPVFFLLGRNDHWAAPELAVAYFDALRASSKQLLWFEKSGHEPFADEPARFNDAMVNVVLPTVTRSTSQGEPLLPPPSPILLLPPGPSDARPRMGG